MSNSQKKFTNQLIHESSPYLLQHAHNPVEWHPWNEETLAKAKDEDKPILVSIGYSACHWCHVMEHESFEDDEVAQMMNENFICIKVDREERPDVDQVYMDAVQAISGRGGWPLNAFALPDGRPFWGATYFPKEQWLSLLDQIRSLFLTQRENLEKQAADIEEGIRQNDLISFNTKESEFESAHLEQMVTGLSRRFDPKNGGTLGAPKFPMPNIYQFLLRFWYHSKDQTILNHVENTLTKMACGGIYDQIGGGFARYSVDDHWHVPHFEKMLYDNAQLVSLYAEAYAATKRELFRDIIQETIDFVSRELISTDGGFYSALDADSEGEEGKFYVWTKREIDEVLKADSSLVSEYFGIEDEAYWEDGKNVLVKAKSLLTLALKYNLSEEEVKKKISEATHKLFLERSKRVRPGLDDKILTSWNALMLKGLVDAYKATDENQYLDLAIGNGSFLIQNLLQENGQLYRNYKNGKATIPGFLDDYSFTIEAFVALYEVTFDEKWIQHGRQLTDYTLEHFFDPESGLFYYTSDQHTDIVSRKIDVLDNVIPSANSSMAKVLFQLSLIFEKPEYFKMANRMLSAIEEKLQQFPSAFTNWGIQLMNLVYPYHTFVITGPGAMTEAISGYSRFLPNIFFAGAKANSDLPVFKDRFSGIGTRVHVCTGRECLLPVNDINAAMKQINL
ncbi:MAG TPA: thioredoxin domain-containing protein [Bacteroidales bacterium]|nr:thioredoxin domain-containing protein [Bacteroidales bacterium]HRX95371.1 thioredoxin domain-containing protein [Bacteroidales bacterium]